jgi:hypothetical protein
MSRLIAREPLYHALSHGYREPPPPRKPIVLPWSDPVT